MERWNGTAPAVACGPGVGAGSAGGPGVGAGAALPAREPAGDDGGAVREMWRLDAQLAAISPVLRKVGLTIMEANRDAAATIAGRHGYDLHVRAAVERGFVWAEFWPCST